MSDIVERLRKEAADWEGAGDDFYCALLRESADEIERMRGTLEEVENFLDERADADQPAGCDHPIPNDEMRLLAVVRMHERTRL